MLILTAPRTTAYLYCKIDCPENSGPPGMGLLVPARKSLVSILAELDLNGPTG